MNKSNLSKIKDLPRYEFVKKTISSSMVCSVNGQWVNINDIETLFIDIEREEKIKNKWCKDCTFYHCEEGNPTRFCLKKDATITIDRVSGKKTVEWALPCSSARSDESLCGKEGKWFLVQK